VLKPVLASCANRLAIKADTSTEYTLVTKSASPVPQHKGQPLYFGSVRLGKACFNFKAVPEPELIAALTRLTEAAFQQWTEKKWV
jgi:hypothetical protein